MSDGIIYVQQNVNLERDIQALIREECKRRRNGLRGFSLTTNQMLHEWLDWHNAGIPLMDTRELQDMPAVKSVSSVPVPGAPGEPEVTNG